MPTVLQDAAEAVWLSETPNLSVRGKRLEAIETFCGSKAAALVMFKEEAERYGVTNPMSLQRGSKPGEKSAEKKASGKPGDIAGANNPWSSEWRNGEEARMAKITSIIKTSTKLADNLSRAAGTVVSKPLRRK
jgi:hypothetical protein